MFDFDKPNIEIAEISEDRRIGKFVVEPLERGYGITLGNSLRRTRRLKKRKRTILLSGYWQLSAE